MVEVGIRQCLYGMSLNSKSLLTALLFHTIVMLSLFYDTSGRLYIYFGLINIGLNSMFIVPFNWFVDKILI